MLLPQVIGFKLVGKMSENVTATDLTLTITQILRKKGVVGKFVEFYGNGIKNLTIPDRAVIANMAPEYGATMGFFPTDEESLLYLYQTGRTKDSLEYIQSYLKAQGLFKTYSEKEPIYSDYLELDVSTVKPCVAGPKRPSDRVLLDSVKSDFSQSLTNPVGFKGYGLNSATNTRKFSYQGKEYELNNGSIVIAAITSSTNTSHPNLMLGAGLLAQKAVGLGLKVKPYIKTSLSPGSKVVSEYLERSGLQQYLNKLGFYTTGYGCMTCVGNSGELDESVSEAIKKGDIIATAVLSGNRNFEGRVHPLTRANYLVSPILIVAYALAGRIDIDFDNEPIDVVNGNPVFLKDLWPAKQEIEKLAKNFLTPEIFQTVYDKILAGNERWNSLPDIIGERFP